MQRAGGGAKGHGGLVNYSYRWWRAASLGDGTASVRGSKKARRRGVAKRWCGGRGRGRWIDTREDREDSKAGRKWSNNNAQIRQ